VEEKVVMLFPKLWSWFVAVRRSCVELMHPDDPDYCTGIPEMLN
jgi:hypothetical protein